MSRKNMFQHVQSVFIIRIHGWIFWFEFLGHAEPALQPPKSVHHCSYFSLHEKNVFFSRMDSRTYLLFCRGRMNPGLDDGLVKELQLTHCWPRTHSTTSRLCFIFFCFGFWCLFTFSIVIHMLVNSIPVQQLPSFRHVLAV